jgi:prepilin-type N-terminal cleavage/methylation domain-containing protein
MKRLYKRGFTFIEVLASVLVLAGTIVPILTFTADSLSTSIEIERRVKSTLLAEGEMEKIKNVLRKSFDTDFTAWPSSLGNNYLADRTSTDISSTLKIIEVSVGYDTDRNGLLGTDEIMITLKTQYAQRS